MKQRKCKQGKLGFCYDYGNCDDCIFSQQIVKYENKIKKLKAMCEKEKKQVIREFTEKLKAKCNDNGHWDGDSGDINDEFFVPGEISIDDIDELLREYEE